MAEPVKRSEADDRRWDEILRDIVWEPRWRDREDAIRHIEAGLPIVRITERRQAEFAAGGLE